MFEKILEKFLKDYIGGIIEQLDSNELNVGIWSGIIDIKKIRLKSNLFQKLNIPINIKYSAINGLSIKIPWKSLFDSPFVVTV